jgi:uncharacterized repeat protein (TIGR02059 family)
LRLSEAIFEGRDVTVAYRDPTSGDDEYAVQDRSGNDANDFSGTVSNENESPYDGGEGKEDNEGPIVVRAEMALNGNEIRGHFNESLGSTGPSASDFAVSVDAGTTAEETRTISSVSIVLATAQLAVDRSILEGRNVVLTYTAPASDDAATNAAIQDLLGHDAASFTQDVDNDVGRGGADDDRAPVFVTAVTSDQGRKIVLTYDEILNSSHPPERGAFTITVDGDTAFEETLTVSSLTINDTAAVLTLNSSVREGQDISLTYTAPTSDDAVDNAAIQDRAGNDAIDLDSVVGNENANGDGDEGAEDTRAPLFKNAVVGSEGLRIVLIYDEILEEAHLPEADAFVITVDEEAVALRSTDPVTVSDQNLTLHFESVYVIRKLQDVTVTYTAPISADAVDNAAIQDRAGNDAVSLSLTRDDVANNSRIVEINPPTLVSAEIRAPE